MNKEELGKEVLADFLKRFDLEGFLIEDLLKIRLYKFLDAKVLESSNKLDDVMVPIVKPVLEEFLLDLIAEKKAEL